MKTKLPYAFTLKNAIVFPSLNAKCFVRFNAICKECKAMFHDKMFQKPRYEQDAIFVICLALITKLFILKKDN